MNMGPNERQALQDERRSLRIKQRLFGLSQWDAQRLDKLESMLQQEEINDRVVSGDKPERSGS